MATQRQATLYTRLHGRRTVVRLLLCLMISGCIAFDVWASKGPDLTGCGVPKDEPAPCPDCPEPALPSATCAETSGQPVYFKNGAVIESVTDVSLPGTTLGWSHSRKYSSDHRAANPAQPLAAINGNRWEAGIFTAFLKIDEMTDDVEVYVDPTSKRTFIEDGGDYEGPDDFRGTLEHVGDMYVLTMIDKNRVYRFYDESYPINKRGVIASISDLYGNDEISFTFSTTGAGSNGRITEVMTSQWWTVTYHYRSATTIPGKIEKIEVTNAAVYGDVVQEVEYTYQEGTGSPYTYDDDTGTNGDLIQVKVSRRDQDGSLTSQRVTQYRYFEGGRLKMVLEPDVVDYIVRAVDDPMFNAESILGKADADDMYIPGGLSVAELASRSFEYYDDNDDTADIVTPWVGGGEDLHAKYGGSNRSEIIDAPDTYMVKSETIRSSGSGGCCGGGSSGVTKTYFYMNLNGGSSGDLNEVTRIVVEDTEDGNGAERYRTVYGLNDDGVLLRKAFTDDPTAETPKYWLESRIVGPDNDKSKNQIVEMRMPSAHTEVDTETELPMFFDPTGEVVMMISNDSATLNDSTGIIYTYSYSDAGYRTATKVKKGEEGDEYFLSATDYGDGLEGMVMGNNGLDDDPVRLPIATWSYPSAETVKTNGIKTSIAYTFWDGDDTQLKTITTTLAKVATSQNGPGDGGMAPAITTTQYFDEAGRLRWSVDGRGYVTYYSYHPDTGGLAYLVQDADPEGLPASEDDHPTTKWLEETDDNADANKPTRDGGLPAALQLVSTTEFDDQGRVVRTETGIDGTDGGSVGTITYIVYEDNRTLVFPAWDTGSDEPLLPIQATVVNDGGQLIEQYTLDPAVTDEDGGVPVGLDGETQANYLSWTRYAYDAHGHLAHTDSYHNIPSSGPGDLSADFHRTIQRHDDMGRREYTIQIVSGEDHEDGVEQITKLTYDILDRVVKVEQGVSDAADDMTADYDDYPALALMSETFYDGATVATEPGVGDGLVTMRKGYHGVGSSVAVTHHYNWRNQLRGIQTPAAPYTVQDVDWMGRVVAVAQYSAVANWATAVGDEDYAATVATSRLALSTIDYDDLGRVFRRSVYAIDGDGDADVGRLVTNNYYDAHSNLVATYTAGAGGTELAYDGADRQYQTRVVVALEDGDKYDGSGNYQYIAPAPVPGLVAGDVGSDKRIAGSGGDEGVVQLAHAVFDVSGNVIISVNLEVNHNDTDGLDLGARDDFVQTAVYSWFDAADRVTATANYGTNNAAWTYADLADRPGSAPGASDTILVTTFTYDVAANAMSVADPLGKVTRTYHDDLGRTTFMVENYLSGGTYWDSDPDDPKSRASDIGRVTKYIYNGLSQTVTQTALDPDANGNLSDNQTTLYLYEDPVSAARVTNVIYPDSSDTDASGTDQVEITYHLDGSIDTRTDQRGTLIEHHYDDLRRLEAQVVTTLGTADGTVRSITRQYDTLGRLVKITSHGDETSDPEDDDDVKNQVAFEYTDFGQLATEFQEHDGEVDGSTLSVAYAYNATLDTGDFAKALRLERVTYPNGRFVHYTYGATDSIDDLLSRIAAINADDSDDPGDPIATYSYNGTGRLVRKELDEPEVRLDYFNGSDPGDPYTGFDRFGRVTGQRWVDYSGSPADIWHAQHGYDRASNRLYAKRNVYKAYSESYTHDGLHRLKSFNAGTFESGTSTAGTRWAMHTTAWSLDALGNHKEIDERGGADAVKHTVLSGANEYEDHQMLATRERAYMARDLFNNNATASHWTAIRGGFDINPSSSGKLHITSLDGTKNDAIILYSGSGEDLAETRTETPVTVTTGRAGLVFGYEDASNFWLLVYDAVEGERQLIQVQDGTEYERASVSSSANGITLIGRRRVALDGLINNLYDFGAAGFPRGRWGLYSDQNGATFNQVYIYPRTPVAVGPRLSNAASEDRVIYDTAGDRLFVSGVSETPALFEGLRGERFEAIFSAVRDNSGYLMFVFHAKNHEHYNAVRLPHRSAATNPTGRKVVDGKADANVSGTPTAVGPLSGSDKVWWRVRYDGTTVTVHAAVQADEPTSWSTEVFSSIYFDSEGGGLFGFYSDGNQYIDNLTIRVDRNNDGDYEDKGGGGEYIDDEYIDTFTDNGSGYIDAEPEHDAAGNLTWDGRFRYIYDAWNRLVAVKGGYLSAGTVIPTVTTASYKYDGLHRRIVRTIDNSADLDHTYHDYYDGQSVVETRNGCDQVLKQHVWGVTYVDELVQVAINGDPCEDPLFNPEDADHDGRYYYAVHNANYNVQLLLDDAAVAVERYEYEPYGERTVYISPGSNDPDCHAPTMLPQRVKVGGIEQPYGICEVGHQGLMHDDVSGLIHNRARMLHLRLQRFMQRDPLGYVDGMLLHEYLRSNPFVYRDPTGEAIDTPTQGFVQALVAGSWRGAYEVMRVTGNLANSAWMAAYARAVAVSGAFSTATATTNINKAWHIVHPNHFWCRVTTLPVQNIYSNASRNYQAIDSLIRTAWVNGSNWVVQPRVWANDVIVVRHWVHSTGVTIAVRMRILVDGTGRAVLEDAWTIGK